MKRKFWTKQEDELLLKQVENILKESDIDELEQYKKSFVLPKGFPWRTVNKAFKDRTPNQCRERFMNSLKPCINTSDWSEIEDEALKLLHEKYPGSWTTLAGFLPARTANAIKLRWRYFQRKKKHVKKIKCVSK